jgi:O-antigen/teichoic acid export membrane protein
VINELTRRFAGAEILKGSASALVIKFAASAAGFTMFAMCSRYMGPSSFGSLAVIFNAICFISVVSLCGQETLIVRSWDEYGIKRPSLARGVFLFGARLTIAVSLLAALGTGLSWLAWKPTVSVSLVLAACAFLFVHSLLQFTGQFSRVAAGVVIGEVPRELLWRLLVVFGIGAFHVLNLDFEAQEFFAMAVVAILVAIVLQYFLTRSAVPQVIKLAKPEYDFGSWLPRSFKMWTSALMDTTSQYLEIVLIGFVLGPTAAGVYFVATRITNVFAMITGSISIYATSRISALFYSDSRAQLQHMLRSLAIISVVINGAALLSIIVLGKLLLWMFGPAYVDAFPALMILAVGASVGALVGPSTHILLLTGHEGAYPRIMGAILAVRALLIFVLAPLFGVIGAATAWSISTVIMAVALIVACRRLVGLDPSVSFALRLPQPSVLEIKPSPGDVRVGNG